MRCGMSERARGGGTHGETETQPDAQAGERDRLHRYFTETAEGRAALAQYFGSPAGRAYFEAHLDDTPQGRAELQEHFRSTPEALADLQVHIRRQPTRQMALRESIAAEIRQEQPRFVAALQGDCAVFASSVMGPSHLENGLALLRRAVRLAWQSDAFFWMLLYRIRMRLHVHGVPVLPTLLHRLCILLGQVEIGAHVLIEPGVYIPHGKVVADGMVRIGSGTMMMPWVTLGLIATTVQGPSIGRDVLIGTGAKVLGPITIGDRARIGANAVVLSDVPPDTTVAGVPARVVRDRRAGAR
jgi:serine O-acetyltransferase